MFLQVGFHCPHRQRAQAQDLTARDNRRQELFGGVGGQDQHSLRRGFLQRLEQGVGGVGVGFLEAQEERHAVIPLVRFEHQALPDAADLFHLQRAAFLFGLDDRQVSVLHPLDLLAGFAFAARFAGRDRFGQFKAWAKRSARVRRPRPGGPLKR